MVTNNDQIVEPKKRGLCSCLRRSTKKKGPDTEEAKIAQAKARWKMVAKLRHWITTVQMAREATDKKEEEQYLGEFKEGKMEENEARLKSSVIYPQDIWKTYFDLFIAILIIYFCFSTPYRLSFLSEEQNREPVIYELVFEAFLLVDIILWFFTAYIDDIDVIDDHTKIAKRYLSRLFIIDLLAVIPFYIADGELLWFKIGRLLRVGRLTSWLENSKVVSRMAPDSMFMDWHTKIHVGRILRFTLWLCCTCHVIACCWHYIAIYQDEPIEDSWLGTDDLDNEEAYMKSLYWTITTFSTVGYGDISPQTDGEIAFTMVVQFLGIMFFAYLMGNVSSIITNINMRQQAMTKRETDLDKWLLLLDKNRSDKPIDSNLHNTIRNYFTYVWKNDHSYLLKDSEFMMRLPYKLRVKLNKHLFNDEVEKFDIFFKGCSEVFQYQMVLNMFPRKFDPRTEIIAAGTRVREIYFINKDSVLLCTRKGVQPFCRLPEKSYFGDEYVLFRENPPMAYFSDQRGCELFCVKRSRFEKLIKRFPVAFENIVKKAYKRRLYFQTLMKASVEQAEPGATDSLGDASGSGIEERKDEYSHQNATQRLKDLEENLDELSPQEEDDLKQLLAHNNAKEDDFKRQALDDMQSAAEKFKNLKSELTQLTSRIASMQNSYESDITNLTDVLKRVSENAPTEQIQPALDALNH